MPPDPVPPPRERPNQRWTPAEENALKAGIQKHGFGKWQAIISDPDPAIGPMLAARTNVDLKDKWRNMRPKDRKSGGKRRRPSGPPTVCDPSLFQLHPATQLPMGYLHGGAGPLQFSGDDPRLLGYGSLSAPGPPSLPAFGGGGGLHPQSLAGGLSPAALLQQQLMQQQLAQHQQQLAHQQLAQHACYGLASPPMAAGLSAGIGGSFGGLSLQQEPSYGLQGHHPHQQQPGFGGAAAQGGFHNYGGGGGGLGGGLPLTSSLLQQQQQQLQQQQQMAFGLQGGPGPQQAPGGFHSLSASGHLGLQGGLGAWGHAGGSSGNVGFSALSANALSGVSGGSPPGGSPFGGGGGLLPASAAAADLQLGLQAQGGAGAPLQGGPLSPGMPAVAQLSLVSPMVRAHSAPEPEPSPGTAAAKQAAFPAGGGGSGGASPLLQGAQALQPGASLPTRLPSGTPYGLDEGGRQRSGSNLAREHLTGAGRARPPQPGQSSGRLPLLHEACAAVDVAAVVAALSVAADVSEATADGQTALHALAAGVQNAMQAATGRAIAAALVQTGLQVNAKDAAGATPLHLAASPAAVEILLAAGASPQDTNNAGETPLFAATERGALGVVNALVAREGRLAIDLQTDCGETALIRACSREELAQIGLLLLQAGASVSPRDAAGRQALHAAAEAGVVTLVMQLLAAGADANSTDASGDTPMMLALRGANSAVVALLNAHLAGGGGGGR